MTGLLALIEFSEFLLHDYLCGRSRISFTDYYCHYAAVDVANVERTCSSALSYQFTSEGVDLYCLHIGHITIDDEATILVRHSYCAY